jgi:sugar fermentation stimulation protein A
VDFKGRRLRCHVPDPGRLKELLIPSATVLLRFAEDQSARKTDATIIGVYVPVQKIWVSIDSQLANRFIRFNWSSLPILENFSAMKPEVSVFGKSRLDFYFKDENEVDCLIEVKTVTLVDPAGSGIAKFPDAPTLRGTRHLQELILAKQKGYRSIVIFVVPRSDAVQVQGNKITDPIFSKTLHLANHNGVELLAYRCSFNPNGLLFENEIPVVP